MSIMKKTTQVENERYHEVEQRHPVNVDHVMARVNSLKKHYFYDTDQAWTIVNRNEGGPEWQGVSNGNPNWPTQESYIVTDTEGQVYDLRSGSSRLR